jgi:hypothetical protein
MNFGLELRLASLTFEMHALVDGFNIIKNSIKTLEDEEFSKFTNSMNADSNLTDDELIDLHEDLYSTIELLYPKVFWSSYLISVFAFFETAVLELGKNICTTIGCDEEHFYDSNNRYSLLEFIKIRYGKQLRIIDIGSCTYWDTITHLHAVRNCYAHANGRLDYCNNKINEKLKNTISKDIGVSDHMGILIVEERFVKSCLDSVVKFVEELRDYYSYKYI